MTPPTPPPNPPPTPPPTPPTPKITPADTRLGHSVTCEHCVDFLLDYDDGTLPALEREKFDAHLRLCPNCVIYLDNYRKAARLTHAAGRSATSAPDAPIPTGLINAILKARKHP